MEAPVTSVVKYLCFTIEVGSFISCMYLYGDCDVSVVWFRSPTCYLMTVYILSLKVLRRMIVFLGFSTLLPKTERRRAN